MPRRGGRGRGRARPPQVVRDAMAEIGLGSIATYDTMARLAIAGNADAARAYFPTLTERQRARVAAPIASEKMLLELWRGFAGIMKGSPHVIRASRQGRGGIEREMEEMRRVYCGGEGDGVVGLEKGGGVEDGGLWDTGKGWMVAECVMDELRPLALREGTRVPAAKKRRVGGVARTVEVGGIDTAGLAERESEDPDARDPVAQKEREEGDAERVAGGDGEEEEEENVAGNAQVEEDEEDAEDFQKMDDDDGYEEHDSGAEEAAF
eukprot:GFKZ01014087.1.p1 GENE.GFKZ01014087.1~~GFKZ01014087.1.p1  ORF type:complete len:308 (-),score=58.81 GFKZ01014087.1:1331-2125(-)